jgi:glutamate decarboxylase
VLLRNVSLSTEDNRNVADLLPYNTQQGVPVTREFLLKLIEVLLEFVRQTNDRNCKVLDFHHPADMRRLLDLDVPDRPVTLQQLIDDCCLTLKYQVKTGTWRGVN